MQPDDIIVGANDFFLVVELQFDNRKKGGARISAKETFTIQTKFAALPEEGDLEYNWSGL